MPETKHPTKEPKSNHIQTTELKSLMDCRYQSGKETHGCFISRRRKHVCLLTTITVPFSCISSRDRFSKQPVYEGGGVVWFTVPAGGLLRVMGVTAG